MGIAMSHAQKVLDKILAYGLNIEEEIDKLSCMKEVKVVRGDDDCLYLKFKDSSVLSCTKTGMLKVEVT